jgi:hypothetical protein
MFAVLPKSTEAQVLGKQLLRSGTSVGANYREAYRGRKGPFTIYARVHVFPEKEAAALCVAVGTHVAVENGKATYSW